MIVGFILFFIAGVAFGFAAPGRAAFLAVLVPILLAMVDAFANGVDGHLVLTLVVAIVITIGGVVLGRMLADRTGERETLAG
jgi:hypothetical protein